jgi:hypothetical protein
MARKLNDCGAFCANSLLQGTGNFWSENREFPMKIREFQCSNHHRRNETGSMPNQHALVGTIR